MQAKRTMYYNVLNGKCAFAAQLPDAATILGICIAGCNGRLPQVRARVHVGADDAASLHRHNVSIKDHATARQASTAVAAISIGAVVGIDTALFDDTVFIRREREESVEAFRFGRVHIHWVNVHGENQMAGCIPSGLEVP